MGDPQTTFNSSVVRYRYPIMQPSMPHADRNPIAQPLGPNTSRERSAGVSFVGDEPQNSVSKYIKSLVVATYHRFGSQTNQNLCAPKLSKEEEGG